MDGDECLCEAGEIEGPPERIGEEIGCERRQLVEMPVHQRADDLVAQALGGGIDREDLARGEGIRVPRRLDEDDVLTRGHLAAVIEPDGPGDEQRLADGDRPVAASA